jgi:ribosomal protein S8
VLYSTPRKIKIINYVDLISITNTGGYFLISTPYGILNDADAR